MNIYILKQKSIVRFWAKVRKSDGCWEWIGGRSKRGYGVFGVNRRPTYAHRISFGLANGPYDLSFHVLHRCDNECCVRPDHLFLGTHSDNMLDMIAKGRGGIVLNLAKQKRNE